MHRHPAFDLLLHDNDELTGVLGSSVTERTTIHEWPLSCVQRIRTDDGGRYIYKVQAPPSWETDFYDRARSPLLVPVRVIESSGTMKSMIMDEIEAPRLNDLRLSENDAAEIAENLLVHIGKIDGELPIMADIRTEDRWAAYIGTALDELHALVREGSFCKVKLHLVNHLRRWAEAPSLLETFCLPSGYVHADLKAENVLVTSDGYRILDWQRPIRGPVALDSATLLISLGIDPIKHIPAGIVQMYHFLHIAWYTQAAQRWLPQGKPWFDEIIASIGSEMESIAH